MKSSLADLVLETASRDPAKIGQYKHLGWKRYGAQGRSSPLAAFAVAASPKLATRAVTGYPTALRSLKIHHPELLVSKPDEASVAVAPAGKPP